MACRPIRSAASDTTSRPAEPGARCCFASRCPAEPPGRWCARWAPVRRRRSLGTALRAARDRGLRTPVRRAVVPTGRPERCGGLPHGDAADDGAGAGDIPARVPRQRQGAADRGDHRRSRADRVHRPGRQRVGLQRRARDDAGRAHVRGAPGHRVPVRALPHRAALPGGRAADAGVLRTARARAGSSATGCCASASRTCSAPCCCGPHSATRSTGRWATSAARTGRSSRATSPSAAFCGSSPCCCSCHLGYAGCGGDGRTPAHRCPPHRPRTRCSCSPQVVAVTSRSSSGWSRPTTSWGPLESATSGSGRSACAAFAPRRPRRPARVAHGGAGDPMRTARLRRRTHRRRPRPGRVHRTRRSGSPSRTSVGGWHWAGGWSSAGLEGLLTVFGSVWLLAVAQRHLDRPLAARLRTGPQLLPALRRCRACSSIGTAVALRPVGLPCGVQGAVVAVLSVVRLVRAWPGCSCHAGCLRLQRVL